MKHTNLCANYLNKIYHESWIAFMYVTNYKQCGGMYCACACNLKLTAANFISVAETVRDAITSITCWNALSI